MKRWLTPRNINRAVIITTVCIVLTLLTVDVFGRVGGGHSYSGGSRSSGGGGGGSGGGSGDGGAIIWLIFQAIRVLIYLTVEYPLIGIPLDIAILVGIVFFL